MIRLTAPRRIKPGAAASHTGGRTLDAARGRILIVVAVVLAAAALLWLLLAPRAAGTGSDAPPAAAAPSAPSTPYLPKPPGTAMKTPDPRLPEGDADPTRDLSSYVPRGANPSMAEVIKGLHERGIRSGLGAFNPPGTSPPLVGLAVPEDFELPKGYVRHHQATDDGQRIEAILMFHPDFQMVDAANRPIPLPANRVVPPELAPAGMPIRRIVIPPPVDPNAR